MAYIYKAENIINSKVYIGKTVNFRRRILEHKNHAKKDGGSFHQDILLYGFDNFIFEVIEECPENISNEREIYFIKQYRKEYGNENVYNITNGGIGGKTHDVSGENNPMYGKNLSAEHKKAISKSQKGKKKSPETCRRISLGLKGKPKSKEAVEKKSHKITVYNINTNEIITFPSKSEMERTLHCSTCTIINGGMTKQGWKLYEQKSVSTIPDECMEVGQEISTCDILGNEVSENRSGRLL